MLFFITGNKNKFAELKLLLPEIQQLDIDLPELQEIDPHKIIQHKLRSALAHHKGPFIVEDTSLYLDCLNGLPGPLGKWFEKTIGNDGIYTITNKLGNSRAHCTTLIGYTKNKDDIHFFEGSNAGTIVKPRGQSKFGFNNIFQPDGYTKTFGELDIEEKNGISMRGIAAKKLKVYLQK